MNLLKEVFAHEVYPAFGCTEPISCAYAAAVVVPRSGGAKGNLIAATLGG